jgi:hypothetical protein
MSPKNTQSTDDATTANVARKPLRSDLPILVRVTRADRLRVAALMRRDTTEKTD